MVDQARALHVPLMAGSSLPVTWRLPALEIPLGRTFKDVRSSPRGATWKSSGSTRSRRFSAWSSGATATASRRASPPSPASKATPSGKPAIGASGRGTLLDHALGRSHTRNPGDIKQNTRDFVPQARRPRLATKLRHPVAFVVEYVDGCRATASILNGHVDDTTIAARIDGRGATDRLDLDVPARAPGACFFNPLVLRIEDFFRDASPPTPSSEPC